MEKRLYVVGIESRNEHNVIAKLSDETLHEFHSLVEIPLTVNLNWVGLTTEQVDKIIKHHCTEGFY